MSVDYDRWDQLYQPNRPLRSPGSAESEPIDMEGDPDESLGREDGPWPDSEHDDHQQNVDFDFDEGCETERREL